MDKGGGKKGGRREGGGVVYNLGSLRNTFDRFN